MEIDRISNGGRSLGTIDVRIHFQLVGDSYDGHDVEWIEGVLLARPSDEVMDHDRYPDGMMMSAPQVKIRNSALMQVLFDERPHHAVRMPRARVKDELQMGADIGTMQAIVSALTRSFDQSRR